MAGISGLKQLNAMYDDNSRNIDKIIIILAAYNGELYIAEQIRSIINQTYRDWLLIIRDDGSSDNTHNIIKDIAELDERIQVVDDATVTTGSSMGNFNILSQKAYEIGFKYLFFCDQDDVWDPNKLEYQINFMDRQGHNLADVPLLSHSDLKVVDENLSLTSPSFMTLQGLKGNEVLPLSVLINQNYVTGCTMAINYELLRLSLPFPEDIIMHDWWMALCAAAMGKIYYIDVPLVRYRQHGSNVIGAKSYKAMINPFPYIWGNKWSKGQELLVRTFNQAKALNKRLCQSPDEKGYDWSCDLSKEYSELLRKNKIKRISLLHKYGIRRQKLLQHLIFIFRVLFSSKVRK